MGYLISVGISAGIIAGIFAQYANAVNVISWVSFAAIASFFAAGGKKEGLFKSIPANLSGVVWSMIIFYVLAVWHFKFAMAVIVLIAVIGMCVQAGWKVLSFIPGSFIGCAATFGTNFNWKATVIALIVGGILGFLMDKGAGYIFGGFFAKKEATKEIKQA